MHQNPGVMDWSRHDEPPGFVILNLTRQLRGIVQESRFQGLGISPPVSPPLLAPQLVGCDGTYIATKLRSLHMLRSETVGISTAISIGSLRGGETAVIITFTAEASSRFQSAFRSFRFADWLT